jgi:pimeloyl-ACP methyl ester carboxylesterase
MDEVRSLTVLTDKGSGRPYVLLHEGSAPHISTASLIDSLSSSSRVIQIATPFVDDQSWERLADQLLQIFDQYSIRQASFVSFGACCSLVQAVALKEPKFVRSIIFIDASTRAHPSRLSRLVDRIERSLPLGLPLRLGQSGFDAKPFLQRIRCPVMIVTSAMATAYQRSEAAVLEAALPTAWATQLSNLSASQALVDLVSNFQKVPAKCPQKGVQIRADRVG